MKLTHTPKAALHDTDLIIEKAFKRLQAISEDKRVQLEIARKADERKLEYRGRADKIDDVDIWTF